MSKQDVNVDVDGVTEPLTKQDGEDGLTKVQFSASPDTVRFGGKPSNFVRSGLSKEELMKYANDPFWVRLRTILFFLFWIVWFAMLIGAIIIIIVAPKCPASSRLKWYQKSSMCKLSLMPERVSNVTAEKYIPIIEKLSQINFDTVIVPPIQNESTWMDIDSRYGTLDDWDKFVEKAGKMNIIMEFDFTRTSRDHDWFKAAESNDETYADMFFWKKVSTATSASSWSYSDTRKDHYLSPDGGRSAYLNFRSPVLMDKMKSVLAYWKNKGLKGFSLVGVDTLINEGLANKTDITLILKDLRDYIYTKVDPKGKTALMAEVLDENNLESFIGNVRTNIADLAISRISVEELTQVYSGSDFHKKMENHFKNLPVWHSHLKIGPWTGLTFNSTGSNQNYIEIVTMAYYMHPNCTAIPIIVDHIDNKTVEHLTILNKYRHEHIDSMLMGEVHYPLVDDNTYSIIRVHPDNEGLLLIVNFGNNDSVKIESELLPDSLELLFNSNKLNATGSYKNSEGLPVEKNTASLFKYTPPTKK